MESLAPFHKSKNQSLRLINLSKFTQQVTGMIGIYTCDAG